MNNKRNRQCLQSHWYDAKTTRQEAEMIADSVMVTIGATNEQSGQMDQQSQHDHRSPTTIVDSVNVTIDSHHRQCHDDHRYQQTHC
jgi:hypothetical protein